MSFNTEKTLFEFFKLTEPDKKQPNDQKLNDLLEESGLVRKRIPEGPKSLMRAISDALYFTTQHHEQIQKTLIKHLTTLLAEKKLPPRLHMFQDNEVLFSDYNTNPHLSGFEKINLELVSSYFGIRIVIYGMSEDYYLNATIINNNYSKSIELLRTTTNYFDPVYSKEFMARAGACQNVVLNILNHLGSDKKDYKFEELNNDQFINHEYDNWVSAKSANNEFRLTKGRHKKSFSDSFHMMSDDQQNKFFDMYINRQQQPDDFLKLIQQQHRKDTMESNFSINANFDFVDEVWNDNAAAGNRAAQPQQQQEGEVQSFFTSGPVDGEEGYVPPPGLSSGGHQQMSDFYVHGESYMQGESMGRRGVFQNGGYRFGANRYQKGEGGFPENSLKRSGSAMMLPTRSNEYFMGSQQYLMQNEMHQGMVPGSAGLKEKKKLVILDDGVKRYTGRLKFFDETKNYGFIVMDKDGSDIFVHYDDLLKANIPKEYLKTARTGQQIWLSFSCMKYIGKYNKSRKATDIQIIDVL